MAVNDSSGASIGDFELSRWSRLFELFRYMRAGLLTTLRTLESSRASGDPDNVEGLLPISAGALSRRLGPVGEFGPREASTLPSQICLFSSSIASVVSPLVLSNLKSGGIWSRVMREEHGKHVCVDVDGKVVATTWVETSGKAVGSCCSV